MVTIKSVPKGLVSKSGTHPNGSTHVRHRLHSMYGVVHLKEQKKSLLSRFVNLSLSLFLMTWLRNIEGLMERETCLGMYFRLKRERQRKCKHVRAHTHAPHDPLTLAKWRIDETHNILMDLIMLCMVNYKSYEF